MGAQRQKGEQRARERGFQARKEDVPMFCFHGDSYANERKNMSQEARAADMASCGRSAGRAGSAPMSAAFRREKICPAFALQPGMFMVSSLATLEKERRPF